MVRAGQDVQGEARAMSKPAPRIRHTKGLRDPLCKCGALTQGMLMCCSCIKKSPDEKQRERTHRLLRENVVDLCELPCGDCTHWYGGCGLRVPEAGTAFAKGCPAYFSRTTPDLHTQYDL